MFRGFAYTLERIAAWSLVGLGEWKLAFDF
jgi:hypothetical protein